MSLDVYNLAPKELTQLNNSLLKYKENSLLKLHNLQRVNHNLIIENTKLRQTLKYGSKERESFLRGYGELRGRSRARSMEVTVETNDDFTAMVYFKCLLNPSEISDYFSCDFSELHYKVVLVESRDKVVQNASTVVTKENQLKLKMLQRGIRYLVAVHLCGKDRKLSGQTEFVYDHKKQERREEDLKEKRLKEETKENVNTEASKELRCDEKDNEKERKERAEKELSPSSVEYTLNLQVDEDYYLTCRFTQKDSLDKVVDEFLERNKLKTFLRDNLLKCVTELRSSGDTIRTVDVTDLV